ncbi:AbrB/MazE/SpoVT family DNA-binding domain-containing protein [Sphingomonas bacterium]|uniref:AbrB/MazE/SpoVT family DNA-binding domain-containing protein n=1 Tax=Sphingomonas bacterium TaxID=1895847 RepID=UPI0015760468|nr:AbrB/MazE/SpoVT family DNA-binding domain-containing protein [Sphingomonas bacterium]
MGDEYRSTSFKAGNSVAVRFPKALGLDAGTELTLREEQGRYIVERTAKPVTKIDLTGIYGSIPGLKPLSPEEREFEERELDWEGKLVKRG